uniref:Uncharacterized protein n=1 Tax=Glossina pallidipes TaxID=7398 RepID=A0A1A9ZM25_GLOPL
MKSLNELPQKTSDQLPSYRFELICVLLCVHQHFRMSPYENVKGDVEMVDTLWFGFLCVCLCDVERIVLDYGEGNLQINLLSLTMHNKIVYVKSRHAAGNFDWQMFYGFKVRIKAQLLQKAMLTKQSPLENLEASRSWISRDSLITYTYIKLSQHLEYYVKFVRDLRCLLLSATEELFDVSQLVAKSRALRSLHRELMCFESVLLGDPQQLVRSLNADELFESVNSEINMIMPDLFAVAFTLSPRTTESPLIKLCFTNDNGFNSLTISSAPSPTEGLLSSMPDTFVISISTESLSLSLSLFSNDPVVELRSVINLLDNSDWIKLHSSFVFHTMQKLYFRILGESLTDVQQQQL